MEQAAFVEATLRIFRSLREASHTNVGVVLQAYLYRSADDLERLLPLEPNLRIVKGAYLEPASVAFSAKRDVDEAYVRLVEKGLLGGANIAVATHDERIISHVRDFAARNEISRDRFEFQMLYGVRPALQRRIAAQGYKVLVATPFGPDWYPYLMRRLAERPANLLARQHDGLRQAGDHVPAPDLRLDLLSQRVGGADLELHLLGGLAADHQLVLLLHVADDRVVELVAPDADRLRSTSPRPGSRSACSSAPSSRRARRVAPPEAFEPSSRTP